MELELHLFINSANIYKASHQTLNLELGIERHRALISKIRKEEDEECNVRLSQRNVCRTHGQFCRVRLL